MRKRNEARKASCYTVEIRLPKKLLRHLRQIFEEAHPELAAKGDEEAFEAFVTETMEELFAPLLLPLKALEMWGVPVED